VSVVEPGTPAPEFVLRREDGKKVRRDDLRGQTSVLVFYPNAFSPVCTDQLSVYQDLVEEFEARGAKLYGVSCDSTWTQKAFRESLGLTIEQLSDFEPKGAASRAFGVYHEAGFPERAIVIIDADGIVQWSYVAPSPADIPGANLIFDGLEATAAA
jgi:peroxiredoxin (alkyl hydroperoxide reductase subunit C)